MRLRKFLLRYYPPGITLGPELEIDSGKGRGRGPVQWGLGGTRTACMPVEEGGGRSRGGRTLATPQRFLRQHLPTVWTASPRAAPSPLPP